MKIEAVNIFLATRLSRNTQAVVSTTSFVDIAIISNKMFSFSCRCPPYCPASCPACCCLDPVRRKHHARPSATLTISRPWPRSTPKCCPALRSCAGCAGDVVIPCLRFDTHDVLQGYTGLMPTPQMQPLASLVALDALASESAKAWCS